MSTKLPRDTRLLELLVERAVTGLDAVAEAELDALMMAHPEVNPAEFDLAAAAIHLNSSEPIEEMPVGLEDKIRLQARERFGSIDDQAPEPAREAREESVVSSAVASADRGESAEAPEWVAEDSLEPQEAEAEDDVADEDPVIEDPVIEDPVVEDPVVEDPVVEILEVDGPELEVSEIDASELEAAELEVSKVVETEPPEVKSSEIEGSEPADSESPISESPISENPVSENPISEDVEPETALEESVELEIKAEEIESVEIDAGLKDLAEASAAIEVGSIGDAAVEGAVSPEPVISAESETSSVEQPPTAEVTEDSIVSLEEFREEAVERKGGGGQKLAWFAAAACLAAAVAGWWPSRTVVPDPDPNPPVVEVERPLTGPRLAAMEGTVEVPWSATDDPTGQGVNGRVVWHSGLQKGFMLFSGLEANDPSENQYQLWIFDTNQDERYPVDGGVFNIGADGETWVAIDAKLDIHEPTLFAVTVEKPGGVVVSSRERIVLVASTA